MKSMMIDFVFSMITRIFKRDLKKQGLLIYLKALNGVRLGTLAFILLFVFFNMMVFSLFALVILGVWLLPVDFQTKLFYLLGLFGFLFITSMAILIWAFSEKTWLKQSGATEMIKNL